MRPLVVTSIQFLLPSGMDRLHQAFLWWPGTSPPLSGPLHSSCCYLQSPTRFLRRGSGRIPLERLCARQQEAQNDGLGRGVHPPVPVTRSPKRLRPHSTFWVHGQFPALSIAGTLPPIAQHGAHRSYGNNLQFRSSVFHLPRAHRRYRKTQPRPASMEIPPDMLSRYFVIQHHRQPNDVPAHVHANVCLHPIFPLSSNADSGPSDQNIRGNLFGFLSRRLLLSSRMSSRNHINPHSPTFSIARRIRRKPQRPPSSRVIENPRQYRCRLLFDMARRGFPINASDFWDTDTKTDPAKAFWYHRLV
jgi:hypothetical protein